MRRDREPETRWDYEPAPAVTLCAWIVFALVLGAGIALPVLWLWSLDACA